MPDDRIYLNGIDGTTGDYLVEPIAPALIAKLASGEEQDRGDAGLLERVHGPSRKSFSAFPRMSTPNGWRAPAGRSS